MAVIITKQPQNYRGPVGLNASFTVEAEGEGLSYQWYWRASERHTWGVTGSTGAKTKTLIATVTAGRNGFQYRCVITDANGDSVTSEAATLIVDEGAAFLVAPGNLIALADVIRTKTGTSDIMTLSQMIEAINNIFIPDD